ncbi:MAG: nucleoside triphosphate pyrophosphohydrolase [Acidobacteria bacterium]|nr:nucleoside triphosphate pyrophosphohydrolase [Acidobacteriota bacterium]
MPESQFSKLVELMARLRAPNGCPWDRQQTYDTIKPFLLEETYEVVDAIARRDWEELAGELGDLMLQIVFFAQMASEDQHFTIEDVIERVHAKMVRRHPHVFGEAQADTAEDVLRNWEVLKAEEKRQRLAERGESYQPPESVLTGVSSSIPSVMEAYQLSSRAAHVGFDWSRLEDLFDKLREEMSELQSLTPETAAGEEKEGSEKSVPSTPSVASVQSGPSESSAASIRHAKLEDEVGDLLFTAVNVARFLKVDPESALRKTNRKFRHRFQWVERELKKAGKSPREATLAEMDALWERSKQIEDGLGR